MLYDIIVADPPWKFASNSKAKPGRNARRHYDVMTDAELCALDVPAADQALLFMWCTAPMLARAMPIPAAWGFRYISMFVWPKQKIATGYWIRNQHEFVLMFKRGRFPRPDGKAPFKSSILTGLQREHSRKPESLQDQIDAIWPEHRKLEMFARQSRLGWDAMGNQVELFDEA